MIRRDLAIIVHFLHQLCHWSSILIVMQYVNLCYIYQIVMKHRLKDAHSVYVMLTNGYIIQITKSVGFWESLHCFGVTPFHHCTYAMICKWHHILFMSRYTIDFTPCVCISIYVWNNAGAAVRTHWPWTENFELICLIMLTWLIYTKLVKTS